MSVLLPLSKVTFNDPALAEVIQRSAKRVSRFQKVLDETSADIRNLEKWLQQNNISAELEVRLKDEHNASLVWNKEDDGWRLRYSYYTADEHGIEYEESKPLIETPVKTRLQCRRHLATIVDQLDSMIPSTDAESSSNAVSSADPDLALFGF